MIKSFVATTREIDDAELAVSEILTALDLENNLLKHSLGIVSCFSEFDETGVLKAICDALPFDCIGSTTCLCASGGQVDEVMFAITVLTSDDCRFDTITIPVSESYEQFIDTSIAALFGRSEERPVLLLSYFPLMNAISGDMMLSAIDKATGGIPLFGTAAVDHLMDYSTAMTIHNGTTFREAIVFGAVYGDVHCSFEIASLDESKIRKQKAIITESSGNILIGVNGKSALAYLGEIGLSEKDLTMGMGVLPLIVDHNDGTKPIARAVFALTPEGHAVCGGAMPVNATLGIGRIDAADVLQTTGSTLEPLLEDAGTILGYSCMARYLVLGADSTAEAQKVVDTAGDTNVLFACSGGEICPLPDANGKLKNFYHNYTTVFCNLSKK